MCGTQLGTIYCLGLTMPGPTKAVRYSIARSTIEPSLKSFNDVFYINNLLEYSAINMKQCTTCNITLCVPALKQATKHIFKSSLLFLACMLRVHFLPVLTQLLSKFSESRFFATLKVSASLGCWAYYRMLKTIFARTRFMLPKLSNNFRINVCWKQFIIVADKSKLTYRVGKK